MDFVTINDVGVTLHYKSEGTSNGETLVFIHSLGCDMRIWDEVVPHLTPDFRVIRFDIRGHGLSDAPPAPYSMPELARDVAGLLDHLSISNAVLIGTSVGGMIALQTALDYPERVTALVLCDTAAKIATPDYWDERINTLRQHGMAHMADTILARWFAPDFAQHYPAAYRGYRHMLSRMPLEGYIGTCFALRDADLRGRLAEITVPVLVMCGAEDAATTPEMGHALANSLPDGRFVLIENAGHTPSVEQPDAVADAILEFMGRNMDAQPHDPYSRGMRIRRAVLGDAHVNRAEANKTDFDADFQRFITETAWGAVWARPGLDRVTRHLLTITMLAALGKEHELAMHIRATQNTGVTPEQIKEVFLQVAIYAGVPAANSAFGIAKKIYAELNQTTEEQ